MLRLLRGCNHILTDSLTVMCTFLHHSDPSVPHYRKREWTFVRGVLATVDRPLFGWIGRFLLHNVGYDRPQLQIQSTDSEIHRFPMTILHITSSPRLPSVGVKIYFAMYLNTDILDNHPAITEAIRGVLGEDYNYDSTVSCPRVVHLHEA